MKFRGRVAVAALAVASTLGLWATPSSATTGAYWHDDGIVLVQGSNANAVGFFQTFMCAWGGAPYTIDGIFGVNTKSRTQAWQSFSGITSDGVVGSNTWLNTEFSQWQDSQGFWFYRLTGPSDGFWGWYGGLATSASLYWNTSNPFTGDMWLWQNSVNGTGNWYDSNTTTNSVSPTYSNC